MQFDTKGDRGDMLDMLDRLPPRKRMAWLKWCCENSRIPRTTIPMAVRSDTWQRAQHAQTDDSASEKLSVEVFQDVWNLALQYELDMPAALEKLYLLVKKHR